MTNNFEKWTTVHVDNCPCAVHNLSIRATKFIHINNIKNGHKSGQTKIVKSGHTPPLGGVHLRCPFWVKKRFGGRRGLPL